MHFRILGSLEVDDDGRSVELGGARQRALLAILLLHRNEVVSADRLIEELYGGRPPPTAAKSLQAHVSRLRGALRPEDRLHTRPGGYVLEVGPDELDADRAARLLAEGRKARGARDHDAAAIAFESALGLWRGRPLTDVAYDGFAQDEIARLEELRLECLEERLETDLERGRHAEVVGDLERLVAEHPERERLRGQLMLALYRSGRQANALAAYQDARRALLDELGIEPGRALQELERGILNQDPRLDAPANVEAPDRNKHPGRRAAGVFVGRERELADILGAFDDARSGTGRLVLLTGEPGIGKSRLADELAAHAQARGTTVLWGRCWEAGGAPAYWPWVQALRSYVRDQDPETLRRQLGAGTSDLAHLLPDLRELFPDVPELHDLESEGARFRLFDAVATFLRNASEATPLVLVLDDLHVADEPSLLMLQFVASGIADARVTLLAIYRDPDPDRTDQEDARLADLGRAASVRIALGGLAETDVASYVRATADIEPPTSVVDAIVRETEGNPLFVGEVVRLLTAEGQIDRPVHASWHLTVPRGVRDVIGRRLRHVSPDCIETLTLASVLGREFGLAALERLSGRSANELLDVLDEAVSARVVADVPGMTGRLRFAHALVRDTLYEDIHPGQRRELHRRAAEAIAGVFGEGSAAHLSELAHHYSQALPAVEPDIVVDHAKMAGDHARGMLAYEEAARLYETALQALSARPSRVPTLETSLLLALGESRTGAGDTRGAKDAFLRAAVVARENSAAEDFAAAALGYGGRLIWARPGGDRLVVALLEEALSLVPAENGSLRARLLARLAGALRDERDPRRRVDVGERAVEIARRSGDTTALIQALLGLSVAQYAFEDHTRRLEVVEELHELGRAAGDKEAQWEANNAAIVLSSALNEFAAVRAQTRALTDLAADLRQPAHLWFAEAMQALLALHAGKFEDAETLIASAYELGRIAHPTESYAAYVIQLYLLRREQGRADEVYELLAGAAREHPARPFFQSALAAVATDVGRTADARRVFEELAPNGFEIVPRDNEWPLSAAFLVETCRALGDTTRAAFLYDALRPLAERSTANPSEGTLGAMARTLGIAGALVGKETEAIAHLRRAIEIDKATGATPWVAYAQVELADVLATSADADEAGALRAEAAATAAALGMERLMARIGPVPSQ